MTIRKHLLQKQSHTAVRLLATSGVATAVAVWEGEIKRQRASRSSERQVRVVIQGVEGNKPGSFTLTPVIRATVLDSYGASLAAPEIIWFNEQGAELGRGRSFNLRSLSIGTHVLRAAVLNTGQEGGAAAWLVERTAQNGYLLHRGNRR